MNTGRRISNARNDILSIIFGLIIFTLLYVVVQTYLFPNLSAIISYILSINIATLTLFFVDKVLAAGKRSRVPERILFLFSLLGGTLGAMIGMNLFRHKTQKGSFQAILGTILLLQIFLLFVLYNIQ